jgi:hypothetical protein
MHAWTQQVPMSPARDVEAFFMSCCFSKDFSASCPCQAQEGPQLVYPSGVQYLDEEPGHICRAARIKRRG